MDQVIKRCTESKLLYVYTAVLGVGCGRNIFLIVTYLNLNEQTFCLPWHAVNTRHNFLKTK